MSIVSTKAKDVTFTTYWYVLATVCSKWCIIQISRSHIINHWYIGIIMLTILSIPYYTKFEQLPSHDKWILIKHEFMACQQSCNALGRRVLWEQWHRLFMALIIQHIQESYKSKYINNGGCECQLTWLSEIGWFVIEFRRWVLLHLPIAFLSLGLSILGCRG